MPIFPITDPRRADDIRMRRRRALLLLVGTGLVLAMLGQRDDAPVKIETGHWPFAIHRDLSITSDSLPGTEIGGILGAIPGVRALPWRIHGAPLPMPDSNAPGRSVTAQGSLTLVLSCADSLTLVPDPSLDGQARLSVRRGQEAGLDGLRTGDNTVSGCVRGDVTVQMAPGLSVVLVKSGSFDMRGGRFTGPMTITQSGSGTVTLDATGPLTVASSESGDVFVGTVSGAVSASIAGSGDLRIGAGDVPRLSVSSDGSGDVDLGHAQIGETAVQLHGSGSVRLGRVEGALHADTEGSGDITIDWTKAWSVELAGDGSGDITVHAGTIGSLTARRMGSGDLTIGAVVTSGTVSHHGDGDVSIPHVVQKLDWSGDHASD